MASSHASLEQKKLTPADLFQSLHVEEKEYKTVMALKELHTQFTAFQQTVAETNVPLSVIKHKAPDLESVMEALPRANEQLQKVTKPLTQIDTLLAQQAIALHQLQTLKTQCIGIIRAGLEQYYQANREQASCLIDLTTALKTTGVKLTVLAGGPARALPDKLNVTIDAHAISLTQIQQCFDILLQKKMWSALINELRVLTMVNGTDCRQSFYSKLTDTTTQFALRESVYALEKFELRVEQMRQAITEIVKCDLTLCHFFLRTKEHIIPRLAGIQKDHASGTMKLRQQFVALRNMPPHGEVKFPAKSQHHFGHFTPVPATPIITALSEKDQMKEALAAAFFFQILLQNKSYTGSLKTRPFLMGKTLETGAKTTDGLLAAAKDPNDPIGKMVEQISHKKNKRLEVENELRLLLKLPEDAAINLRDPHIISRIPQLKNQRHKLYCAIMIVHAHLSHQQAVSPLLFGQLLPTILPKDNEKLLHALREELTLVAGACTSHRLS